MAIYNQGYPQYGPYQPYTPTPANYLQSPAIDNTGIIWVQGESGAKAYPVQNGKSAVLFDSESEHFFIKTTDISGMPQPLRIFSYSETNENEIKAPAIDTSNFVTRDEFDEIVGEMNKLKAKQNTSYQKKEGQKVGKPII